MGGGWDGVEAPWGRRVIPWPLAGSQVGWVRWRGLQVGGDGLGLGVKPVAGSQLSGCC